jgi:hypothetical protein
VGTCGSGYGGGRPGWRRKCEHLLALDARVLARRGRLIAGMYEGAARSGVTVGGGDPLLHWKSMKKDIRIRSRAQSTATGPKAAKGAGMFSGSLSRFFAECDVD